MMQHELPTLDSSAAQQRTAACFPSQAGASAIDKTELCHRSSKAGGLSLSKKLEEGHTKKRIIETGSRHMKDPTLKW